MMVKRKVEVGLFQVLGVLLGFKQNFVGAIGYGEVGRGYICDFKEGKRAGIQFFVEK